jgi:hypothetical protein
MTMMITLPKNAHIWLPELLRRRARHSATLRRSFRGSHVMFAIADHFEPFNGGVSEDQADRRVARWHTRYRSSVAGLRDVDGRMPQHSFFYPLEQYRDVHVDALGALVEQGVAEVEVHLHHDRDTSSNLRRTLLDGVRLLQDRHGLLSRHADGAPAYGFVHGNWALDNARPDGAHCGVDDEISVLRNTGCYADFTLPAAPDASQTRTVNSIYYALDDPRRSRSHDSGTLAAAGRRPAVDGLLMVQGPLSLDWSRRKYGVIPGLEAGTLDHSPGHHPSARRFRQWVAASVVVTGRPDWIFVKVHTHGAPEGNADVLLGRAMREFHEEIQRYTRGQGMYLHYVTAREIVNIIHAAEDGAAGDPGDYRDYRLPPPRRRQAVDDGQILGASTVAAISEHR